MSIRKRIADWLRAETPKVDFKVDSTSNYYPRVYGLMATSANYQALTDPYCQHPVVYSCIKIVAENLAGVPWLIVKDASPEKQRTRADFARWYRSHLEPNPATGRPGLPPTRDMIREEGYEVVPTGDMVNLFTMPNPLMSGAQFWRAVVSFLEYHGETVIYCKDRPTVTDWPSELYPLAPQYFYPKPDYDLVPSYWFYRDATKTTNYQTWELIRPRHFNPNDIRRGLSPLAPAGVSINLDWSARMAMRSYFDNDCKLSTVFMTKKYMNQDQRADWIQGFNAEHKGAHNAYKAALITGVDEVKTIAGTPKDSQALEQMERWTEEIAMIWHVPKVMLSRTEDINYATDKAERRGFWTTTLVPIGHHIEDIFWSELFADVEGGQYWGVFDFSSVPDLGEDVNEKLDQGRKLFDMRVPFRTVNERLNLGVPEFPHDDLVLVPSSDIPVDLAASITDEPELTPAPAPAKSAARADGLAAASGYMNQRPRQWARWRRVYRGWLLERRKEILNWADATGAKGDLPGDAESWGEALLTDARPTYEGAIDAAIRATRRELDSRRRRADSLAALDRTAPLWETGYEEFVSELIASRRPSLMAVSETIIDAVQNAIAEAVEAGDTIAGVKDAIKGAFNVADSRALTIARTEVGSAQDNARVEEMTQDGVEEIEWSTAGDNEVRDSHRRCEEQGPVKLGNTFSNGCRWPHDPQGDAGEVINCRCVALPVISEEQ